VRGDLRALVAISKLSDGSRWRPAFTSFKRIASARFDDKGDESSAFGVKELIAFAEPLRYDDDVKKVTQFLDSRVAAKLGLNAKEVAEVLKLNDSDTRAFQRSIRDPATRDLTFEQRLKCAELYGEVRVKCRGVLAADELAPLPNDAETNFEKCRLGCKREVVGPRESGRAASSFRLRSSEEVRRRRSGLVGGVS
jgi:hypothetical protein